MKLKYGVIFLVSAALIAMGNAIAHLSCIFIGPACYAAQMAPPILVESARNGTYLAPIANIFVSAIFIVLGLYALSAAGVGRKLPLLKYVIFTVATLCIVRGILPLQFWLRYPDKVNDVAFYYGVGWFVTGLLYLFGYLLCANHHKQVIVNPAQ